MTRAFDERSLRFEFDDRWQPILKWDDHVAYHEGIRKIGDSKAMDFVGVCDKNVVFFIEARDYRNYQRTKTEDPRAELECKVRDTIAGLIGTARRPEHAQEFEPFLRAILNRNRIVVVLWNEQPPYFDENEAQKQRDAAGAGFLTERAKSRVKWLHARIIRASQADQDKGMVPGLTVTNRARKPRELAGAILKRLDGRRIPIDAVTRARIAAHTDIRDLEVWLERAATILKIEELFDERR